MTTQPRISASRVPMLLNESKWGTRLSLYHELRGEGPPRETNEVLEEGIAFEPVILRQGAKKFRMQLVDGPRELIHGDLIGHPDGYVIDEHGKLAIAESKNLLFADVGEEAGWGEAETDRVPMAYWYQCQTYGFLLLKAAAGGVIPIHWENEHGLDSSRRWPVSDTVYLFARLWHGLRRYQIKVDPAVCARIESEASAFLDRVARGEPPDPTTGQEFRQRWSPVPEKAVEFGDQQIALAKAKQQLKANIKAAEAEVEKIDMLLLGYMQDASVATYRGKRVLTASANRRFDQADFMHNHPDLWNHPDYRTFDSSLLRQREPGLYERFMRMPPAEQQTRVLRASKALEDIA